MHLALFPRRGDRFLVQTSRSPGRTSKAEVWVALSVDTRRPASAMAADAQDRLHATSTALHALCGELDLPATWGVPEPLTSPLVDRLRADPRANPPHEIGLRLDPTWSSPKSRRMLLAELLARNIRKAEMGGLRIATLFADKSLLAGNHDLLVKRGITSVRGISAAGHRWGPGSGGPRQLRYGLWEYCVSRPSLHERPLVPRRVFGSFAVGHRAAAAASPRVLHLSLEASRLTGNRSAWRNVERSLRLLARLRNSEGLHVEPLHNVTVRLVSVPAAAPQRSILRRAA